MLKSYHNPRRSGTGFKLKGRDNPLFSLYTATAEIYPCMVPLFWFKKKTTITGQASARVWLRNVHTQVQVVVPANLEG